ncbi:MAG: ATP-binding protein [Synergistaceae bacterium]|nr:ATP-binding protein [Synergistaceae bacterium]
MNDVYEFISEGLAALCVTDMDTALLKMTADEIVSNIMNYAYEHECKHKWVTLEIRLEDEAVVMTFIDGGRLFDPLTTPTPDVTQPASERVEGGLGIYIVRSAMDDVSYSRDGARNILTVRKKIERK